MVLVETYCDTVFARSSWWTSTHHLSCGSADMTIIWKCNLAAYLVMHFTSDGTGRIWWLLELVWFSCGAKSLLYRRVLGVSSCRKENLPASIPRREFSAGLLALLSMSTAVCSESLQDPSKMPRTEQSYIFNYFILFCLIWGRTWQRLWVTPGSVQRNHSWHACGPYWIL